MPLVQVSGRPDAYLRDESSARQVGCPTNYSPVPCSRCNTGDAGGYDLPTPVGGRTSPYS
jgi:hypothetical protein